MLRMTNTAGGLLITLHDRETLDLYLQEQVYGFLLPPLGARSSSGRTHYSILADYACARTGTHAFFLYKREIVYAGQIVGNTQFGSFYLNGDTSPLGKEANAHLFWDESARFVKTPRPGIFLVRDKEKCQPAVVLFKVNPGMTRRRFGVEDFYFRLSSYPYPLPSKATQDLGLWTLTPGETQVALDLLSVSPEVLEPLTIRQRVVRGESPILFDKRYGIQDLELAYARNELLCQEHIEFSVISNPQLLPADLRPSVSDVICRQVPLSPPKPYQIDRAGICFYDREDMINGGTLPNRIVELKTGPANERDIDRVERYLIWLQRIADPEDFRKIKAYLLAPSFQEGALTFHSIFSKQIILTEFSGRSQRS
jgi:hypothetical protein